MGKKRSSGGRGNHEGAIAERRNKGRPGSYVALDKPTCRIREGVYPSRVRIAGSLEYFQTFKITDTDDGSGHFFHMFYMRFKGASMQVPLFDVNRHGDTYFKSRKSVTIVYTIKRVFLFVDGLHMPIPVDVRQIQFQEKVCHRLSSQAVAQ